MPRIHKTIFFVVCLAGFLLRLYILRTRDIHYDEAIYNVIAYKSTFWQVVSIDHPVKDHGILYFLVLKLTQFFTNDIISIRLINLVFYLISYWAVVKIFTQRDKYISGLLAGILFSFSYFFVYLYTFLTPYNLVLSVFLCSFYFLERFQCEEDRKKRKLFQTLFVVVTASAWYANYSFLYTAFFYLFYFFLSFFIQKKITKTLFILYGQVVVLMVPGIIQVLKNLTYIRESAQWLDNRHSEFSRFFIEVGTHLLFQHNTVLSAILFFYFIFIAIFFLQSGKTQEKHIYLTLLSSFGVLFVFIYVINEYYIGIKLERTFWLPYISIIMLLSLGVSVTSWQFKKNSIKFVVVILLLYLFGSYKAPLYNISGRVNDESRYMDFISSELLGVKNKIIYVYDPNTAHNYPLWMYYFSKLYPKNAFNGPQIHNFLQDNAIFFHSQRTKDFTKKQLIDVAKQSNTIILMFEDVHITYLPHNTKASVYILTFNAVGIGRFIEKKNL